MVKCTLIYYDNVIDVTEDSVTLEAIPELSKFLLTVEKVN